RSVPRRKTSNPFAGAVEECCSDRAGKTAGPGSRRRTRRGKFERGVYATYLMSAVSTAGRKMIVSGVTVSSRFRGPVPNVAGDDGLYKTRQCGSSNFPFRPNNLLVKSCCLKVRDKVWMHRLITQFGAQKPVVNGMIRRVAVRRSISEKNRIFGPPRSRTCMQYSRIEDHGIACGRHQPLGGPGRWVPTENNPPNQADTSRQCLQSLAFIRFEGR